MVSHAVDVITILPWHSIYYLIWTVYHHEQFWLLSSVYTERLVLLRANCLRCYSGISTWLLWSAVSCAINFYLPAHLPSFTVSVEKLWFTSLNKYFFLWYQGYNSPTDLTGTIITYSTSFYASLSFKVTPDLILIT